MDIYVYVFKIEVIGMLGGCFYGDDQYLEIIMVIFCNSISIGFQCEMDLGQLQRIYQIYMYYIYFLKYYYIYNMIKRYSSYVINFL